MMPNTGADNEDKYITFICIKEKRLYESNDPRSYQKKTCNKNVTPKIDWPPEIFIQRGTVKAIAYRSYSRQESIERINDMFSELKQDKDDEI